MQAFYVHSLVSCQSNGELRVKEKEGKKVNIEVDVRLLDVKPRGISEEERNYQNLCRCPHGAILFSFIYLFMYGHVRLDLCGL